MAKSVAVLIAPTTANLKALEHQRTLVRMGYTRSQALSPHSETGVTLTFA